MTAALCTWAVLAGWFGRGRLDIYRRRRQAGAPVAEAVTGHKSTAPVPDVTAVA